MSIDLSAIALTNITTDLGSSNVLLYGKPKVGKSTLASQIPNSIFAATEKGYNFLQVRPKDINKWEDFLELGQALCTQKHTFKTVVVDTCDILYKLCEKYVMDKHQVNHPSDLGFGKGFSLVRDEFSRVVNKINMAGFGFVFISHAKEKTEKTKTGEWTVMGTSLSGSPETFVAGLCDIILYCYITDDGKRVMRTKPTKYILAGDRSTKLPEIMPMDYALLTDYLSGKKTLTQSEQDQNKKRESQNATDKVPNLAPQMIKEANSKQQSMQGGI